MKDKEEDHSPFRSDKQGPLPPPTHFPAVNMERRRIKALMKLGGLVGGRQKRKLKKMLNRIDKFSTANKGLPSLE